MAPPMKSMKPGYRDSDDSDTPSSNLWVGNLSADATDSDLTDLFAKFGPLDRVTTYSARSFAFVYFKRVEDAAAAKEALQGTSLRGNALKIEFARPAKPSRHLWVGGISPSVSKEHLKEEFLKFGEIEDFKFLRDRNTAFVEYFRLEDASQAMKIMNGKRIGGDQIRVDYLRSQPSRREMLPDFRDLRENQIPILHPGLRRDQNFQLSVDRREGQPSNVLWVGYPASVQIDEQMLHNAMILFGEIERIKSFPSRHYSFVEFRSIDEARRAKEGLQGRLFNDPRITIMFSSSEISPGKDYPTFYPGVKRLEMFNDNPLGPGEIDVVDPRQHFPGPFQHGSSQRSSLPVRQIGPQGGFDPVLSGTEFNDLPTVNGLRDGNSILPGGPNWRRPSPPASGLLPSPSVRFRPPIRSSSGWDVLDGHQYEREAKRTRIDGTPSLDDDVFPPRRIDERALGLEPTYGLGASDRGMLGPSPNLMGKNSLSPVGGRPIMRGQPKGNLDVDYIWRGTIAKGGTPVCHARCVPIGNGIESDLPEVVNCSARTGLDMLAKHYNEAIGFDVVFFLPDSEEDFASYTEFLRYLGTKNRAGVAKFDDGTTLFLVPPSDFLSEVLKVTGPERLYGVVLKLPQVPGGSSIQPQLCQPIHFPQHIGRPHLNLSEADFNGGHGKEEQMMPADYNRVLNEDPKLIPKSFYPSTVESVVVPPPISQSHSSSNTVVSQAGVSLTPELLASLASLLPNVQSSASDSGQTMSISSMVRPSVSSVTPDRGTSAQGWNHENQVSGSTTHLSSRNQFSSQVQVHPQFQPYQSVSNAATYSANVVPDGVQMQDYTNNIPHQGTIQSMPPISFAAQSGQFVPQQGANYLHTQSGVPLTADKVNWDSPSQMPQSQTTLPAAGQSTSKDEADKNQRYQSTLQFAASLLLQIQQQQQHQSSTSATRGSGNQQ
ncbi:hypothetical protein K2173_019088 [Erythroxylum novogranatense]|uniref:RRM domain-containing protein n=1 Tax=Erythroxylum novogranatense TaxID=1862640 RepID=A0AAV8SSQ4_9ROSI|nr:hypothetical protein K2173_019088 [Erythroxylum novogranatense]